MPARLYFLAAVIVSLSPAPSQAQTPASARDAMKKLDFLVGEWKGEGWMEVAPGQRRTLRGTEVVQSKLDGLLLTIEGLHRGQVGGRGERAAIHNAFVVVSYDDKAKRYRCQAYTGRGNYEDGEAKVADGRLVWAMKVPQFGGMRYTIKAGRQGAMVRSRGGLPGRQAVAKFFEMTLPFDTFASRGPPRLSFTHSPGKKHATFI